MPWKELSTMKLREEFVVQSLENDTNFSDLCREFGISRKTGYKWKERYLQRGITGLKDQSRRPLTSSEALSSEMVGRIIALKVRVDKNDRVIIKNYGPKKIHVMLKHEYSHDVVPSISTIARFLDKSGLVRHRKKRRQSSPDIVQDRIIPEKSNDVWTVDFKGWWLGADHKRCEPLTIRDEYAKFVLAAKKMATTRTEAVKAEFIRTFTKYGLPGWIRSDNGPPFASTSALRGLTRLAVWWISLGIRIDRIDLGCPCQNGGHERMHRDIRDNLEIYRLHSQAELDEWRREFNYIRPHEALGMKTPGDVYVKSRRLLPSDPPHIVYPSPYHERKVIPGGYIKFKNDCYFLTTSLTGHHVGLKYVDPSNVEVWYDYLMLGIINLERRCFIPHDQL